MQTRNMNSIPRKFIQQISLVSQTTTKKETSSYDAADVCYVNKSDFSFNSIPREVESSELKCGLSVKSLGKTLIVANNSI